MNELQDPSDANAGGTSSSEVALTSAQDSKLKVFESSPDLQALCKDNGISARQFARKSDTVTVLEMFLGFWPSMKSVMHFPSLRELFIINHPTISAIEGLEVCANLEVLCITECSLSRITGVGQCAKLRHVNFSKNKLKNIENLDALNQLEILWVNENMLETLDGLRKLTKLSQLWACQNQIDSLDTALNSCTTLQELNLAGNRLNNFKGLLPLASLDCLTTLILSDPHFGDNPVCRLCNYQTYLLCHLSHLTHLDTIEVSARNRQTAETTMIKKKVYYNMRIRSIRRDACMQIKRYEAIRRHAEQQIDANIAALTRQKKEIESFLCDYFLQLNETAPRQNQVTIQLEKKVDCLNACLKEQCADIHRLYTEFDQLCVDFLHASDRNASRLLLELGTAGNIRLEDGKSSDAWYSSCIDLVRSRLSPADLKKFEVEDIKINRVTRVSNRFLRNRFHSKMEAIVGLPSLEAKANVSKKGVTVLSKDDKLTDASAAEPEHTDGMQLQLDEAPSRGQDPLPGSTLDVTVEYLFYLPSKLMEHSLRSSRDAELYYVAENGFRDPTEYGKTGHESAIKLSNSIALLDSAQLTADLDRRRQSNESVDSNAATPRVLMIVKVFPGYMKCIPESEAGVVARASTNSSLSPIRPDAFPGLSCLQVHSGAPFNEISPTGPKIYYMFDEALVLPEYIVEYQYVRQGDQDTVAPEATTASTNSSDGPTPITEVSESIDMMTPRQAGDLMSDIADVGLGLSSPLAEIFERKYRSQSTRISTDHSGTDEAVTRILHMGPSLPETSSMMTESPNGPRINAKLLALKAGNLHKLSLIGCKLEAIPDLASVVDLLEVLVLSYNSIQSIDNLIGLSKLRVLDLSYNRLAQLRQLEHLQALESLDISHNQLQIFSEVAYVGRSFAGQALRRLDLRNNPLCKTKRYRLHAIQCVSYLHQLDQQDITANEATIALQLVTKLSRARVWEVGTRSSSNQQKTRQLATSAPLDSAETWTSVEDIDLSHELISTIEGLDLATNLLVANFADNLVDSLNGLDACRRLDELCLDDNKLTRIEHLENLVLLKKLYLGRNSICAIEGLDTLENLVQLSLEDNQISSLRGLGSLLRLMELYLGNNRVETLKEMQHLKSLPRLTILDLVGNDIASLPDYRSYSVYYLRRLKVLDGITVTPQDQSNAKQKYSGKLTLEFAMEKCGVGNTLTPRSPSAGLDRIVELDLSSCRLREISVIARANFPNLRELNLENNQISDTAELDDLPSLRRLNLNRNRIERLVLMRHVPSSTESTPARTIVFARLECLYLAYNQISDIAMLGLHLLHELKVLLLPVVRIVIDHVGLLVSAGNPFAGQLDRAVDWAGVQLGDTRPSPWDEQDSPSRRHCGSQFETPQSAEPRRQHAQIARVIRKYDQP